MWIKPWEYMVLINPSKMKTVSVIIPCRNEAEHIADCLDSVFESDFTRDNMEVIVVDGLSSDSTREIVSEYAKRNLCVKLLSNPLRIVPSAMNIGLKAAKGEYIIRLDAHSQYPDTYIKDCLDLLESTKAANAGGGFVVVPNGEGAWALPVSVVTAHRFGVGSGAFRVGLEPGFVDTVPFGAFRKEIFEEVGLFDERLTRNQDNEFNDRLRRAGYKIAFDPAIKIFYKNQATLAGLLHQAYYTGMWNIYTLVLHPYTFKWRRFVPAVFVAYLLSLPAIVSFVPWGKYYLLPALLYLTLNLAISLGAEQPLSVRGRIAVTFFSYHLAYGLGTWLGVINVITGRWRDHLGKPLRK